MSDAYHAYFIYSPLMDMTEQEAYLIAEKYLREGWVIDVRGTTISSKPLSNYIQYGGRYPRAPEDARLVRVEQDGSTRLIHDNFGH